LREWGAASMVLLGLLAIATARPAARIRARLVKRTDDHGWVHETILMERLVGLGFVVLGVLALLGVIRPF